MRCRASNFHLALQPGDVLVADRGFCSSAHLALLKRRGVPECVNIFETNFPDLYRRRSLRRLIKTWSMPGLFFYARVA